MAKKSKLWDELDEFSQFFRQDNYWPYKAAIGGGIMLMNSGRHPASSIFITKDQVIIHNTGDKDFYSFSRDEWGPEVLLPIAKKEGQYSSFGHIYYKFMSYKTLSQFGKFLIDECGMRLDNNSSKRPQCCTISQTLYDDKAYYTIEIKQKADMRFSIEMEIDFFERENSKNKTIKFDNLGKEWNIDQITDVAKRFPIRALVNYINKYKKYMRIKNQ